MKSPAYINRTGLSLKNQCLHDLFQTNINSQKATVKVLRQLEKKMQRTLKKLWAMKYLSSHQVSPTPISLEYKMPVLAPSLSHQFGVKHPLTLVQSLVYPPLPASGLQETHISYAPCLLLWTGFSWGEIQWRFGEETKDKSGIFAPFHPLCAWGVLKIWGVCGLPSLQDDDCLHCLDSYSWFLILPSPKFLTVALCW